MKYDFVKTGPNTYQIVDKSGKPFNVSEEIARQFSAGEIKK